MPLLAKTRAAPMVSLESFDEGELLDICRSFYLRFRGGTTLA